MRSITLNLSLEVEAKLRESMASRDAIAIQQLLAEAFAPTVEALLQRSPNPVENDREFDALIDRLADEFAACVGADAPVLCDRAVSREGIYNF